MYLGWAPPPIVFVVKCCRGYINICSPIINICSYEFMCNGYIMGHRKNPNIIVLKNILIFLWDLFIWLTVSLNIEPVCRKNV